MRSETEMLLQKFRSIALESCNQALGYDDLQGYYEKMGRALDVEGKTDDFESAGDLVDDYIRSLGEKPEYIPNCVQQGEAAISGGDTMTETESLLQLWADILADVQADKAFMQQVERDAQDAAFRTRSGAVRAEVMRRLQKAGALPGKGVTPCNTN